MSILNKLKKKRIVATILAVMSVTALLPTQALAHDTYFIQSLINNNDYTYIGNVINDSASFFSDESKHFENELGVFDSKGSDDIIDKDISSYDLESLKSKKNGDAKEGSDDNVMPLSFPGLETDDDKGKKINANGEDADRAYYISTTLYSSLNDALKLVYADSKPTSIPDLVTKTEALLHSNVNGWTISYGTVSEGYEIGESEKDNGIDESCYVTLTKDSLSRSFIYKIPKGYKTSAGKVDLSRGVSSSFQNDAEFISWGTISYEAIYAYYCHDFTFSNAGQQAKVGVLEQGLVSLCQSVIGWVRNLLGLYSIDELVFNQGIRGSKAFYNGIFDSQWQSRVMIFYFIFLGLAIALIIFAIIRILIKRNIATINSSARYDMINGIQKLLISGFVLAFLFPVINMITKFNSLLVQVFYSTTQGSFQDMFINMSSNTNVLGAFILQFVYLFISIYLNFTYIMRGIVLALLIASAPLFVIFMALGDNTSKIAEMWIREFLANVFLQSVHALMLTFFTTVSISSRGIEQIIVFGSLIIVTNLFKGLVLGSAGETAGRFGTQATNTAQTMIAGALSSMGRGRSYSGTSRDSGSSLSSSSQIDDDDVNSNIKQADSSKFSHKALNNTGDFLKNTGSNILHGAGAMTKLSSGIAVGAMGGDSNASARLIKDGISDMSGAGLKQGKDTFNYGKNMGKDAVGSAKANVQDFYSSLDEMSDGFNSDYGNTSEYTEEMNKTGNPLVDGDKSMGKTYSGGRFNEPYDTTHKDGSYSSSNFSSGINNNEPSINTSSRINYDNNRENPLKGSSENNNNQSESESMNTVPKNNSYDYSNANNSEFYNNGEVYDNRETYDDGIGNNYNNNYNDNRGNSSSNFNWGESSENTNSYDNYSYTETDNSPINTVTPGSEKEYQDRNLNENNYMNNGYIERKVNNEIMGNDNSIVQDVYNINEKE